MSWTRLCAGGLLLGLFLVSVPGRADTLQAEFDAANRLYEEGKYAEAIAAYEQFSTNGTSVTVAFNLGNAHFKSGQLGSAIAAYLRAQRLAPRDPDVRANLQFAREKVATPGYRPGWLKTQVSRFSFQEWLGLTSLGAWCVFGLLALAQVRPPLWPALRPWTLIATLLLFAAAWFAWMSHGLATGEVAVVITKEAVVRHGPFSESGSAFTARDGTELRVLSRKDNWLEVTGGPAGRGWIIQDSVTLVP